MRTCWPSSAAELLRAALRGPLLRSAQADRRISWHSLFYIHLVRPATGKRDRSFERFFRDRDLVTYIGGFIIFAPIASA